MINPSTYHIAEKSVPEHIRTNAPKFIEFLKAYYKFMLDYDVEFATIKDVDLVAEELVLFLKKEFAPKFPEAKINNRKLIPILNFVFKTKGTKRAAELLFKLFFDDVIIIDEPSKNILKASGGNWKNSHFITLDTTFGSIPENVSDLKLRISSEYENFFFEVDNIEQISSTRYRIFYKKVNFVDVNPNQKFDLVRGNELVYRGKLVKSPRKLEIGNAGKFWRIGQVIIFPGSNINATSLPAKNSIAIVRGVSGSGSIRSIEIIEYGYENPENEIFTLHSVPKPPSAAFELDIETVSYDPLSEVFTNNYTLTLTEDLGNGISDAGTGLADLKNSESYFLENYINDFYSGSIVASWSTDSSVQSSSFFETGFSYEDWLDSRTTLALIFDWESKTPGSYFDAAGQISNSEVRLQDGFFYQLFSYVINTQIQYKDFSPILNLVHAAGFKYFGNLVKVADFEVSYSEYRRLSTDVVFITDNANSSDNDSKSLTTDKSEELTSSDVSVNVINKPIASETSASDTGFVIDTNSYYDEIYFGEDYMLTETTVSIG
jgi:hypothetical protein